MSYYVYVLLSEATGRTYTGHSGDLVSRIQRHNSPDHTGRRYTGKDKGPWRLIYSESYPTRSQAMKREKELKSGKGRDFLCQTVSAEKSRQSSPEAN